METFIKVLLSGYLVGLTCMGYLLVRSYEVHFGEDNKGPVVTISKDLSANWLGIALFSMTVSYTWCLIGAAVFTLVSSNTQFLHFSLAIAMLCAAAIFMTNTKRKMDKIAISFIVVIGTCLMFVHVFKQHQHQHMEQASVLKTNKGRMSMHRGGYLGAGSSSR